MQINKILQKYKININKLTELIIGKSKDKILSHLVSSQLDADRMDYLLRDSKSAGVPYSNIDIEWIIRHTVVKEGLVFFYERAKYAIENYLVGRYHMYKQIYTHDRSVAFDALLVQIIKRLKKLYNDKNYFFDKNNNFIIEHIKPLLENEIMDVEKYCELDDYVFSTYLKLLISEKDKILSDLCYRMWNGKLFKRNKIKNNHNKIKNKLLKAGYDPEYYYVKKVLKKVFYYDFEKIKQNKKHEVIWIITDLGKKKKFIELSDIIDLSKIKNLENHTYYYTLEEFL